MLNNIVAYTSCPHSCHLPLKWFVTPLQPKTLYGHRQHQGTIILTRQEKQHVQYNPKVGRQDACWPPEGTAVFTKEGSLLCWLWWWVGFLWAFALDGVALFFFFYRPGFKGLGIHLMGVGWGLIPNKLERRSILPQTSDLFHFKNTTNNKKSLPNFP